MPISRRQFVKSGAAITALHTLGQRPALAAADASSTGFTSYGRIAWPAETWYRPYVSKLAHSPATTMWLQIDLGNPRAIESVRLHPAFTPGDEHAKGYGFPVCFRIEASDDASFANPKMIFDRSTSDFTDPYDQITAFASTCVSSRYVRLTATQLRPAQDGVGYSLAISKIDVVSGGKDVVERCSVTGDGTFVSANDLAQITRPQRPMGEGIVTDNPTNVMPADRWRTIPFQASVRLVASASRDRSSVAPWTTTSPVPRQNSVPGANCA